MVALPSVYETKFLDDCNEVIRKLPGIMRHLNMQIQTKEHGWQAIVPNNVQLSYHKDRLTRGFEAHDNVLKARKHGVTTWEVLEALALAYYVDGFNSAIVVHVKSDMEKLFKIARQAYNRLSKEDRERRPLNEDRRDAIDFNGSGVYIYTAGGRGVGRGMTYHKIHGSEVAFWPNAAETWDGIVESGPRFARLSRESTPNGRENYFYDVCNGDTSFKLQFFPWWCSEENALPLKEGEVIVPSDEEQDVIMAAASQGWTITPEKLKWRRSKLQDLKEKFFQEHPEDPETCFLMSGNPVHDANLLRRMIQRAEASFVMQRDPLPGGGEYVVWRQPSGLHPYVITSDVAEGLVHGDWSTVSVWQHTPDALINVARGHLKCSTDDLAIRLKDEGEKWHNALIAVERNASGGTVLRKLETLGYTNLYNEVNVEGDETDRAGWHTNVRTKRVMIEEFASEVASGNIISFDPLLWGQAMSIVKDELGRPVTPRHKHDDIYISACIANMAKEQAVSNRSAVVTSYA